MSITLPAHVPVLGLFEKRIQGDDALLELARCRFKQSEMGMELHPGNPSHLLHLLQFRPAKAAPVVVHLPREFDLLNESACDRLVEFAAAGAGQVVGLVIHDNRELPSMLGNYVQAAQQLEQRLSKLKNPPSLFIEYAAGVELESFVEFFHRIRDLRLISACLDVGHVGIRQVCKAYEKRQPGIDVCSLRSKTAWKREPLVEVESAVKTALQVTLNLMHNFRAFKKPVHFHLHDGHPLSNSSPFGVADHLSFLARIPVCDDQGVQHWFAPMYGEPGLIAIIRTALETLGSEQVSFTFEIHPSFEREPLGDASGLFHHWRDKTNAEQMNHWLSVLIENRQVFRRLEPPSHFG